VIPDDFNLLDENGVVDELAVEAALAVLNAFRSRTFTISPSIEWNPPLNTFAFDLTGINIHVLTFDTFKVLAEQLDTSEPLVFDFESYQVLSLMFNFIRECLQAFTCGTSQTGLYKIPMSSNPDVYVHSISPLGTNPLAFSYQDFKPILPFSDTVQSRGDCTDVLYGYNLIDNAHVQASAIDEIQTQGLRVINQDFIAQFNAIEEDINKLIQQQYPTVNLEY